MAIRRDNNVTRLSAAGAGVGRIQNSNSASVWIIGMLSVITSPTSSGCTCVVTPPTGIVDTSYFAGTGDTAQGMYVLMSGDYLDLTWSGGPASGQGIATYIYQELEISDAVRLGLI